MKDGKSTFLTELTTSSDIPVLLSQIVSGNDKKTNNTSTLDPYHEYLTGRPPSPKDSKSVVNMKRSTGRDNHQANCMPTRVGSYDHTFYRNKNWRDRNLSSEDQKVLEKEKMMTVIQRIQNRKDLQDKTKGLVELKKCVGRREHFLTRYVYTGEAQLDELLRRKKQESSKNLQTSILLRAQQLASENRWNELTSQQGDDVQQNDTLDESGVSQFNVDTKQETKPEEDTHQSGRLPKWETRIKGGGWIKSTNRDNHFLTRLVYRKPNGDQTDHWPSIPSTVVFDSKRAKVDPLLNQGSVLDWNRISARQPLQVTHYDTNYNPIPVFPHTPACDFSSTVPRETPPVFENLPLRAGAPGEYQVREVRGDVHGGSWSKDSARPKPKTASCELYGYDRIMKRLKERKRKEKILLRKAHMMNENESPHRTGVAFGELASMRHQQQLHGRNALQ